MDEQRIYKTVRETFAVATQQWMFFSMTSHLGTLNGSNPIHTVHQKAKLLMTRLNTGIVFSSFKQAWSASPFRCIKCIANETKQANLS